MSQRYCTTPPSAMSAAVMLCARPSGGLLRPDRAALEHVAARAGRWGSSSSEMERRRRMKVGFGRPETQEIHWICLVRVVMAPKFGYNTKT